MGRTNKTVLEVLYEEFQPETPLKLYNTTHGTELTEHTKEVDKFTRKSLLERSLDLGLLTSSSIG